MRRRAGFTLVEMMVAVLVGSVGVVLAAKVAQVIVRQSAKSRQTTDFHSRTRLVTKQLRADIRTAGMGSTGAVAVDPAVAAWAGMRFNTAAGYPAIPAVKGVNNLGAVAVGGATTLAGSDAVQLVVPDPGTTVRSQRYSQVNTNTILLDPTAPPMNCPTQMIYVSDHSGPNGAGRAQIMFQAGVVPNGVTTTDLLQFTVGPGSDVSCARVSTYWVDTLGWMHRSDLSGPGALPTALGNLVVADPASPGALAPGVIDLQLAYRVSAEVYVQNGAAPPVGAPSAFWIFEGVVGNPDAFMATDAMWFEVRMVRFNLLSRTVRRVEAHPTTQNIARREDAAALPPIPLTRALNVDWIVSSEALTNLRYFDLSTARGVRAEPY
jgi:prepilin-type N-terminal cleavage/methylation domain-containing protein